MFSELGIFSRLPYHSPSYYSGSPQGYGNPRSHLEKLFLQEGGSDLPQGHFAPAEASAGGIFSSEMKKKGKKLFGLEDPFPMEWSSDWLSICEPNLHEAVRLQEATDPWRSNHRNHEADSLREFRRKRQQECTLSLDIETWEDMEEIVA